MSRLLIDGHLDLAMNAIEWNRDLTWPLEAIRRSECDLQDKVDRGAGVVSLPEMRRGGLGICVATWIARYSFEGHPQPGWRSPEIAWAITQAQLAWYRALEENGEIRILKTRHDLEAHAELWRSPSDQSAGELPIGIVMSLEGADSILSWRHLERAAESGLRAIGPAHYGPGVYSPGTGSEGGLTLKGKELLAEMQKLGLALDVTHLTDEAFWEALELFFGFFWASHRNCRWLVDDQRQLDKDQMRALADRDAVIGTALDAWMLVPGWDRGKTKPEDTGVSLSHVADHIDAVCQLLGSSRYSVIGSDLDGGFGKEQAPGDLDSIADLQQLERLLRAKGYSDQDIEAVFSANWLRCLGKALPE